MDHQRHQRPPQDGSRRTHPRGQPVAHRLQRERGDPRQGPGPLRIRPRPKRSPRRLPQSPLHSHPRPHRPPSLHRSAVANATTVKPKANPKSQTRNPKQMEVLKEENRKADGLAASAIPPFGRSNFFRISSFGFRISLLAAFFFLAIFPTLNWLEFSGGSENLVIATALETRRQGSWIVPTLKG